LKLKSLMKRKWIPLVKDLVLELFALKVNAFWCQVSDFLFINVETKKFPSKRARNILTKVHDAVQLSLVTRTRREKRGTIVVAIIGAIVTIESHYRGIMWSAARNSGGCFLNASRTQNLKDRKSTVSFERLSPPYIHHPLSSPLAVSFRWKVSTSSRSFFFGRRWLKKRKNNGVSTNGRRFWRFYRVPPCLFVGLLPREYYDGQCKQPPRDKRCFMKLSRFIFLRLLLAHPSVALAAQIDSGYQFYVRSYC